MSIELPLALQYAVVAVAVTLSAWVALRKQFPAAERRLRIALALPLLRPGRPAWLRGVGRWIAPAPAAAGPGCAGCDDCSPGPRTSV